MVKKPLRRPYFFISGWGVGWLAIKWGVFFGEHNELENHVVFVGGAKTWGLHPPKTNMTGWKTHHLKIYFLWKIGCSNVMLVNSGVWVFCRLHVFVAWVFLKITIKSRFSNYTQLRNYGLARPRKSVDLEKCGRCNPKGYWIDTLFEQHVLPWNLT